MANTFSGLKLHLETLPVHYKFLGYYPCMLLLSQTTPSIAILGTRNQASYAHAFSPVERVLGHFQNVVTWSRNDNILCWETSQKCKLCKQCFFRQRDEYYMLLMTNYAKNYPGTIYHSLLSSPALATSSIRLSPLKMGTHFVKCHLRLEAMWDGCIFRVSFAMSGRIFFTITQNRA